MIETSTVARASKMAGYTSAEMIFRFSVAVTFEYSTYRRRTASRLPLRSPASSEAVYTRGKRSPWAIKASDRADPDRTRSWTSSRIAWNAGDATRLFRRSRDWTSGMPAFSSVASSWLKIRNSRMLMLWDCGRRRDSPATAPLGFMERTCRPFSWSS